MKPLGVIEPSSLIEVCHLPAPLLEVRLLGPLEVRVRGELVRSFRASRVKTLLAYLAAEPDLPRDRGGLLELLWPEQSTTEDMRQTLARLRRMLEPGGLEGLLQAGRHSILLRSGPEVSVDVRAFRDLQAAYQAHCGTHPGLCPACAARLEQACALYRGEFCADVPMHYSEELSRWCDGQRDALRGQALQGFECLADWHFSRGRPIEAEDCLRGMLEVDPFHEAAVRGLLTSWARRGEVPQARAFYETWRRRLRQQLGASPEPATRELVERIGREPVVSLVPDPERWPVAPPRARPVEPASEVTARAASAAAVARERRSQAIEACLSLLQSADCRMLTVCLQPEQQEVWLEALLERASRRLPGTIQHLRIDPEAGPRAYRGRIDALLGMSRPGVRSEPGHPPEPMVLVQSAVEPDRIDRSYLLTLLSSHTNLKVLSFSRDPLMCRIEYRFRPGDTPAR